MTINNDGEFVEDSVELILDAMIADVESLFDDDIPDSQVTAIRSIYKPIAERLAEAQDDVGLVLASSQIENAEGTALDLLTALVGVHRKEASKATGQVTFSRDTTADIDYSIPKGTLVTTEGVSPTEFKTTESATLVAGSTSVQVDVQATTGGEDGNVGVPAITRMPSTPVGVESVENNTATSGGSEEESDNGLRERAQDELADGSSATAAALISACKGLDYVRSVSIYINDTATEDADGLPPHSFELVVEAPTGSVYDDGIASAIMDTKAAGDTSYHGVWGDTASASVTLSNGQSFDIYFSRPVDVDIFVDVEVTTDSAYEGDSAVQNAVVEYIGGYRTSGNTTSGDLNANDDVVYYSVVDAIMDVNGVTDITSLTIGESDDPTGTDNLPQGRTDVATTDARDSTNKIDVLSN